MKDTIGHGKSGVGLRVLSSHAKTHECESDNACAEKNMTRGLSIKPENQRLVEMAEIKARRMYMSFSGYVMSLIERDLTADPPSNLKPQPDEQKHAFAVTLVKRPMRRRVRRSK